MISRELFSKTHIFERRKRKAQRTILNAFNIILHNRSILSYTTGQIFHCTAHHSIFSSLHILQCLERNLLRLMHARALNRLQLGQEFTLQRVIICRGPLSVLLQWLSDANLKVQTSTTDLTGDGCAG